MSSTICSISKPRSGRDAICAGLPTSRSTSSTSSASEVPSPAPTLSTGGVVATEQIDDHPRDVPGVDVIAHGGAVAVEDDLLAALDVMQEGDDGALAPVGLLVLAVEGRAAQDPGGQPGLLTGPADRLLTREVQLAIERARTGRGILGNRYPVRLPVHGPP